MNTVQTTRISTAERKRRNWLLVAYFLRHLSVSQAAEQFGVSERMVCRILHEHAREMERTAKQKCEDE
ncbi:MAG: helix-turn-helix domain-containing protein [Armatimonadetes bacterium]|nr:helix-turn-helix domain-containing protein [Armatimonadota bacterium]